MANIPPAPEEGLLFPHDVSAAEAETLAQLVMSCQGMVTLVGKILRQGWDTTRPALEAEVGRFTAITKFMQDKAMLDRSGVARSRAEVESELCLESAQNQRKPSGKERRK